MKHRIALAFLLAAAGARAQSIDLGGPPTPYGPAAPSLVILHGFGPNGRAGTPSAPSPWIDEPGHVTFGAVSGFSRHADWLIPGSTNVYLSGTGGARYGPLPWLSLNLGLGGAFDDNDALDVNFFSVGRLSLGATAGGRVGPTAGALRLDVLALPSVGGPGWAGVGAVLGGSGGYDFGPQQGVPLRVFGGLSLHLDDTAGYADSTQTWFAPSRLAFDAQQFKRISINAAVELYQPRFSVYADFRHAIAAFGPGAPSGGLESAAGAGGRMLVTDNAAVELALQIGPRWKTSVPGVVATPPLMLILAFTYRVPLPGTPQAVDVFSFPPPAPDFPPPPPPPAAPPTLDATGKVTSGGRPVPGAVVTLHGPQPGTVITDAGGSFTAPRLVPGHYRVVVSKDGFRDADATMEVVSAWAPAPLAFELEPVAQTAVLTGNIADTEGSPLSGRLIIAGAGVDKVFKGKFRVALPAGAWEAQVKAEGYLLAGRSFQIRSHETVVYDFILRKAPKVQIARIEKSQITITQRINFESGKAVLLPDAYPILDEIADVILGAPRIKLIEVGGHTDDVGDPELNRELSMERAIAVADYLALRGVNPRRLKPAGYGDTRPVEPGKSDAARARNRRVEFKIVKSEGM